jgi:hypothetical protein
VAGYDDPTIDGPSGTWSDLMRVFDPLVDVIHDVFAISPSRRTYKYCAVFILAYLSSA